MTTKYSFHIFHKAHLAPHIKYFNNLQYQLSQTAKFPYKCFLLLVPKNADMGNIDKLLFAEKSIKQMCIFKITQQNCHT